MSQINNRYKRSETSGQFKMRPDKTIIWESVKTDYEFDLTLREWVRRETIKTELTPEQSPFKLAKTMDADVVLLKEKDSDDSLTGKVQLYYHRKMRLTVRPEFNDVWICKGKDFRLYVKDLKRMCTYRSDLTNDELCVAKKLSEKRVSQEQASKIETGYVYNKYENDGSGNELFGKYVAPINTN